MKKETNLDGLFREKLINYEQEPPAYILDQVLAGVASAKRRKRVIFWRFAGVAAALLLAFVAGWQFNTRDTNSMQKTLVQKSTTQPSEAQEISSSDKVIDKPEHGTDKLLDKTQIAQANSGNKQIPSERAIITNNSVNLIPTSAKSGNQLALNSAERSPEKIQQLISLRSHLKSDIPELRFFQGDKLQMIAHESTEKSLDELIMEKNHELALTEKNAKAVWLVGAQVSPAYSITRSSHSQSYASSMLSSSSNPVDLGGGISVEFKKGKRWSLQSGIYYASLGQSSGSTSSSNRNLTASADFSTNKGYEYFNAAVNIDAKSSKMMMNSTAGVIALSGVPAGIVLGTNLEDKTQSLSAVVVSDASFVQNFGYLEIPLYLRYTILDWKFDVEMMGGFSSNLLVGNNTYMESNGSRNLIGSTQDMQSINYSGTLGIGLKYGLAKRFYLNVEPRVKYYLNSLNTNSSVTYKPYTIGVFTGLSYEF